MSTVQWPWPSDRILELERENQVLRDQVKRLMDSKMAAEDRIAAVWAVVRESQRLSLTETSNSDILDALGTP